jgi:HK97 family phage prohead protease
VKHKAAPIKGFKALDEALGQFEAIVSVFDNVDLVGDRVVKGAFSKSLDDWKTKGRPIPVVFSHLWDNLDAHIGQVLTAEERDEGLYVKAQLDMEDPPAAKTFKLMQRGTLAEFSFSYDVIREKAQNGANELLELDLIEVGPTLKGANPETQLLTVKALGLKAGRRNAAKDAERIQTMHDLAVELEATCEGASSDDESDDEGKALRPRHAKAAIAGSYERTRELILSAAREQYAAPNLYVFLHSTFEDRAVIGIIDWRSADGMENASYREVDYTLKDGAVDLGEEREVSIETIVTPKAATSEATDQEPERATSQEPKSRSTYAARIALELLELDAL